MGALKIKRFRFLVACCFSLVASLSCVDFAFANSAEKQEKKTQEYALTISGGISLGAYEAGLNWALVKILKDLNGPLEIQGITEKPKLVAVTGASAGGINALASVISWCAIEDNKFPNTLKDNLFRDFWMPIGFGEMLPPEPEGENLYKDGDGLLSRVPFVEPLKKLESLLAKDGETKFHNSCTIGMGFNLSIEKPISIEEVGVTVPVQSIKLPISVTVANDRLVFKPATELLNRKTALNMIALPTTTNTDGSNNVHQIKDAVLATSAFPVAFGRKLLGFCIDDSLKMDNFSKIDFSKIDDDSKEKVTCPVKMKGYESNFLDGGVLDNIPLDLAIDLAKAPIKKEKTPTENNSTKNPKPIYIYLDPDRRRTEQKTAIGVVEPEHEKNAYSDKAFGLLQQTGFISGAVSSGRTYELYNALRENKDDLDGHLILSDRFQPITGTMLHAFGAFLDRNFRELDYLIGVYDATVDIAYELNDCKKDDPSPCPGLGDRVKELSKHLQFADSKEAQDKLIFSLLFCEEFKSHEDCAPNPNKEDTNEKPLVKLFTALENARLLKLNKLNLKKSQPNTQSDNGNTDQPNKADNQDECEKEKKNNLTAQNKTESNQSANDQTASKQKQSPSFRSDVTFCELAMQLKKPDGIWTKPEKLLNESIKSPERWYETLALRVTRRLYALEKDTRELTKLAEKEGEPKVGHVAPLVGVANYWLHGGYSSQVQNGHWRWSDTPIDTKGFGGWFAKLSPYEVGLDTRHGGVYVAWSPKLRVFQNTDLELKVTPIALPASGENVSYYTSVELGPRYRVDGNFSKISSYGAGVGFQHDWQHHYDDRDGWSNNVNIGFLNDKLRLTGVFHHDYGGKSWGLMLGVTDFQGFVDVLANK